MNHTEEELRSLTNDRLREMCTEMGLSTSGDKSALVERLMSPSTDDDTSTGNVVDEVTLPDDLPEDALEVAYRKSSQAVTCPLCDRTHYVGRGQLPVRCDTGDCDFYRTSDGQWYALMVDEEDE